MEHFIIPSQVPIRQLMYPSEHELQWNADISDTDTYTDNISF